MKTLSHLMLISSQCILVFFKQILVRPENGEGFTIAFPPTRDFSKLSQELHHLLVRSEVNLNGSS